MADDLAKKAVVKILHFATWDSGDATIDREEIIECTEAEDGIVELAFDLRRGRQRTYIRMNRSDLLRMIEESP